MADNLPTFTYVGGNSPTQNSPIGFPTGYKPPLSYGPTGAGGGFTPVWGSRTLFGTDPQSDQYMPGDEWKIPLSHLGNVPNIKQRLLEAGLLTNKTFGNPAVWDANAANAYQKVLEFANGYGMQAQDALDYFVNNPKAGAGGAGAGGPKQSVISYTNPQDLEAQYSSKALDLTGQEQQNPAFVDYYHGLEGAAQHQTGTNYTSPPGADVAAKQYIEQNDPSQVQAYGVASRMADFLSMVGAK